MNKKKWIVLAVLSLILAITSFAGYMFFGKNVDYVSILPISTGEKNHCLAYDDMNDILYVGTHEGSIIAYNEGKQLWRVDNSGVYSELVLSKNGDKLYAGNENNFLYVYDTDDGSTLLEIPVERRIIGLDINSDDSKIAVVTNTGTEKSNILVYSNTGEKISNIKGKFRLRGVEFYDDETLISVNKVGQVQHITVSGEELKSFKTEYEIVNMTYNNGLYWVLGRDGTYYALDKELNCERTGKIDNSVSAEPSIIGVDQTGKYILIGSEEGYVFLMNEQDEQIYISDHKSFISGIIPMENEICFTGYDDFVKCMNIGNLEKIAKANVLKIVLLILGCVLAGVGATFFIIGIPVLNKITIAFIKSVWRQRNAYIMLLPTFILLYFFCYRGIGIAVLRSFTDWSVSNVKVADMEFIGIKNYISMFKDGYFMLGLKNLLLLLVTNIIKTLTVPMLVAWLLYSIRGDKSKYIHRFLFVLPMVVPSVVSALVWQKIYDPNIGLINNLLGLMNLEQYQRVWLGNSDLAIWAILFMGFPYVNAMALLVYYGGMINIDNSVIESALMDGGGKWNIFWKIQLPMIWPQISIMLTLTFINSMKEFNNIFILTGGGPGTATYVPALEIYLNAAQYGRYGYASAEGVVLLIAILLVTVIGNKMGKEKR